MNSNIKILIINCPQWGNSSKFVEAIRFPLGIAYIISVLKSKNANINFYNANYLEYLGKYSDTHLLKNINIFNPDLIFIAGLFPKITNLISICKCCKRIRNEVPIICGGMTATYLYESILKRQLADIIVIGEGERCVIEIIDNAYDIYKNLQNIKGIAWLNDNNIIVKNEPQPFIENLDSLPFPDRSFFQYKRIFRKYYVVGSNGQYSATIQGSRGCFNKCAYCSSLFGKTVRIRSNENILSEIFMLQRKYAIGYFHFVDEQFLGSKEDTIMNFCEQILSNDMRFSWSMTCSYNPLISKSLILLLKRSGCKMVSIGVETVDKSYQNMFSKKVDLEIVRDILQYSFKIRGPFIRANFIVGFPEEKLHGLYETYNYINSFNMETFSEPPMIGHIKIMPGSYLYNKFIKKNEQFDEFKYLYNLQKGDYPLLIDGDKKTFLVELSKINCKINKKYLNAFKGPLKFLKRSYNISYRIMLNSPVKSLLSPIYNILYVAYKNIINKNNKFLLFISTLIELIVFREKSNG